MRLFRKKERKKRYIYSTVSIVDYLFNERMTEVQKKGWEQCGPVLVVESNHNKYMTSPIRRRVKISEP